LLGTAGIVTLATLRVGRPTVTARALAIGMGAAYLAVVTWIYPRFDAIKSARAIGEAVRKVAGPAHDAGAPVYAHGLGNVVQGIAFYSDGVYVRVVDDLDTVAAQLASDQPAYAVLGSDNFADLPEPLRARLTVSGRFEMSRLEVLLVSNTG
jgi:hypothetical protein